MGDTIHQTIRARSELGSLLSRRGFFRVPIVGLAFLLLLTAGAWTAGCPGKPPLLLETTLVVERRCSPLERLSSDEQGIREKLAVEVRIGGEPYRMQLDTGSERSWLYGDGLVRALSLAPTVLDGFEGALVDLEIGARRFPGQTMLIHPPVHEPDGLVGTLGMDFLLGKLACMDFADKSLCIFDDEDDPAELWPGVDLVAGRLMDGRLVVPWRMEGGETVHLFYDTGTGVLPFLLGEVPWRVLTGRTDGESGDAFWPDPVKVSESSRCSLPGLTRSHELVGRPLAASLSVGGYTVDAGATIYRFDGRPGDPPQWPSGVHGLSGNCLFRNRFVVIDAREGTLRFGVGGEGRGDGKASSTDRAIPEPVRENGSHEKGSHNDDARQPSTNGPDHDSPVGHPGELSERLRQGSLLP